MSTRAMCCESPPGEPRATSRLASRFSGVKETAMSVDNPPLGNLAQPAKRIAMVEAGLAQSPHGFHAHLLQQVVDFDLAAERGAKAALDESRQRAANLL